MRWQQQAIVEFDAIEAAWEASPLVVPRTGKQVTPEKLTNMLRGDGHLTGDQKVQTSTVVPLVQRGVAQTFRLEVTYASECGLPSVFIAKFLNTDPSFSRFVRGAMQEVWAHSTQFLQKHGARQPCCYFASYDPVRKTFCLLLEDLSSAGFSSGDLLTGGPGEGEPPHLPMFIAVMESAAVFHAR